MRRRPAHLTVRSVILAAPLAALALSGCATGASTPNSMKVTTVQVRIVPEGVGQYLPGRVTITPGQTVTWSNETPAPHNVVFEDLPAASSKLFATGEGHTARFDTPGEFAYVCTLHPTMRGVVVVD